MGIAKRTDDLISDQLAELKAEHVRDMFRKHAPYETAANEFKINFGVSPSVLCEDGIFKKVFERKYDDKHIDDAETTRTVNSMRRLTSKLYYLD